MNPAKEREKDHTLSNITKRCMETFIACEVQTQDFTVFLLMQPTLNSRLGVALEFNS